MRDIYIYYGLTMIAFIITLGASSFVNIMYKKYSKVKNSRGISGAEAARKILDANGLSNIYVVETQGVLTDHYDPSRKVIRLSSSNYNDESISALAVAAHECGHALQDKNGYLMFKLRSLLVPFTNFSTRAGYIILVIGIIAGITDLIWAGIALEAVILLFELITLPVELNASRRAMKQISDMNLLSDKEYSSGKNVLRAAALTYVAAVASSMLEILRLILIYGRKNRD